MESVVNTGFFFKHYDDPIPTFKIICINHLLKEIAGIEKHRN